MRRTVRDADEPLSDVDLTPPSTPTAPPDLRTLFVAFLFVGLSGFGGVLPWARRMLVEEKRWLTAQEFVEALSLAQVLPGPNVVNVTIVVGMRFRGIAGAAAGFLGLMTMPIVIVLGLAALYGRYGDLPAVENAFRGVSAAAAGLIVAMAVKISAPLLRSVRVVVLACAVFVAMAIVKVPLVWVLALAAPASILWTWGSGRGRP